MAKVKVGRARAYVDGRWQDGRPLVLGPHSHAVWLSSVVFDGARAFDGVAPDLDRHCARVVASARILGLAPKLDGAGITALAWQGIRQFPEDAELYVCPMFYAEDGFIMPDPDSTRFVLTVYESALPAADGFSACLSSYRRPAPDMAPTRAKASCLYPNVARSVAEAGEKGFDTAVVLDPDGNVAEFAYANLFMVLDGVVLTPAPNGTFLDGINPPAGHRAPARGRPHGPPKDHRIRRPARRRRAVRHRQLLQGGAVRPPRGPGSRGRPGVPQGPRALFRLRPPWLKGASPLSNPT